MDKKERIHEEADKIFNGQKDNYSVTEMVILVQSQYYNIEDMFTYGANLKSNDINEHIDISKRIFSICNSFQNNLKLIPDIFGWKNSENQKTRVEGIKLEMSKSLELQKATKEFQDSPSHITAQKLQSITSKIQNES